MITSTAPLVMLGVLGAVFGLAIGSFLNVVVYRVPAGMSVVAPPSACPNCEHVIRSRDNIPVLSWLLLRGRCRDCATRISARYPLVELGTGVFFVVVTVYFGQALANAGDATGAVRAAIVLTAGLYVAGISVALTLIDLDEHRLPNKIVLPAYPVLLTLLLGATVVSGDWEALVRGLIGLAVLGAFYLVLAVAVPRGMGFGDVKLAGVLGFFLAYLGWGPLAVGAFGAFLLGGIFACALVVTGRAKRGSGIPFGPWMLGGAWVGVFFGSSVLDGYLRIIGLA